MKTALIFGSSGLIGSHLLNIILQNNKYNKVKTISNNHPQNILKDNLLHMLNNYQDPSQIAWYISATSSPPKTFAISKFLQALSVSPNKW